MVEKDFFIVPTFSLLQTPIYLGMRPSSRILLVHLMHLFQRVKDQSHQRSRDSDTGIVYASDLRICSHLDMNRKTAYRARKELSTAGIIEYDSGRKSHSGSSIPTKYRIPHIYHYYKVFCNLGNINAPLEHEDFFIRVCNKTWAYLTSVQYPGDFGAVLTWLHLWQHHKLMKEDPNITSQLSTNKLSEYVGFCWTTTGKHLEKLEKDQWCDDGVPNLIRTDYWEKVGKSKVAERIRFRAAYLAMENRHVS